MTANPLRAVLAPLMAPFGALALLVGTAPAALAQPATPAPSATPAAAQIDLNSLPHEVSIPNTRKVAFVSKVNGHAYAIQVALPFEPAPAKGYRVIYVLDGDGYFGSVTEAVRLNGNTTGTVVVGIGYPDTPEFIKQVIARHGPPPAAEAASPPFVAAVSVERQYDMALPATEEELAGQTIKGMMAPKTTDIGGMDDFLRMIEVDIKPRVAAMTRIDASDQSLFGHSLGGLTVVHALFTEPQAFRTFIAASPSIWWADNEVLKDEPAFTAKVKSGAVHPRVLITVGALEQQMPVLPPSMAALKPQIEVLVAKARMVDNARDLAARLQALQGQPPYKVADIAVFPEQEHGISPWPAIGRGVAFATQP
jgi:predicted alpha/beta superfamily hydrolase